MLSVDLDVHLGKQLAEVLGHESADSMDVGEDEVGLLEQPRPRLLQIHRLESAEELFLVFQIHQLKGEELIVVWEALRVYLFEARKLGFVQNYIQADQVRSEVQNLLGDFFLENSLLLPNCEGEGFFALHLELLEFGHQSPLSGGALFLEEVGGLERPLELPQQPGNIYLKRDFVSLDELLPNRDHHEIAPYSKTLVKHHLPEEHLFLVDCFSLFPRIVH